ncbi:MAG: aminotransferase class V-fold PLP-dependent enzyme [Trueperaceae bacterium]|nr:aminotransferase class V-fold PLP-dependent enzyme [Trueperaceae bacterium]
MAVPPSVLEALARPVVHHRTDAFRATFVRVRAALAEVLEVAGDEVMLLTGSGTTAFEAALVAAVPRGAHVLALRGGKFGDRWAAMARAFGYRVSEHDVAWGRAFDVDGLRVRLADVGQPDAVTLVHSETSTGVLHDVAALAEAVRTHAPDALVLVDAVTSLAAAELRPRAWGLDAVVAGSQKGVMLPPGLGFAWLSERAWARGEEAGRRVPAYTLDLHRERPRQRAGDSGTTPATSLVVAAEVALGLLLAEGLPARRQALGRRNRALLAAGRALGAEPFAERASPAVAAMTTPEGLAAPAVVRALADRGVRIAGGQDHLASRLIRPSLLGHGDDYDAVVLAAALEDAWRDLGRTVASGAAVAAAMAVLGS